MSRALIIADAKQWGALLEEISKEVEKVMDDGPKTPLEKGAFAAFSRTLRQTNENMFPYLPPGNKEELLALCATWLDVGMLFGKSPALLVEILKRTGVSIGLVMKEGEGGDAT